MMRATLSFLTIAVIALPMTAQARNPSALEPNGELAVHGTVKGLKLRSQDAKAASKRLYKLYYKVELAASEAFKRKSDPTSIPFETLCKDIASLDQAAREAAHLQLMGEPAGTDLGVRIRALKQELHKLIWAARSTQRANRYRQKMIEKLKKAKPKNDSFLKRQEQAIKSGQLESAEVALEKFATKMAEDTQLLTPKEREPYVTYMLQLLDELERRLRAKRLPIYRGQAAQAMRKEGGVIRELDAEMGRGISELQANGKATIGENVEADHLDALEYLDELWGSASAGLLRSWGIQWMYSGKVPAVPIADLRSSAERHLVGVINAAAKLPAPQVREIYPKILNEITKMDRKAYGKSLQEVCESALGQLAAVDADLPAQISAYKRATSEILRWKRNYAAQRADVLQRSYARLGDRMVQEAETKKHNRAEIFRAPPTKKRMLVHKNLSANSSWTVYEAGQALLGSKVYDTNTIRFSPTSRTSVVPFKGFHYSSVAVGLLIDPQVDQLKSAVLVDDTHPPLSFEVAGAFSSAGLREFQAVGGTIHNMHIEPFGTRFISLPNASSILAARTVTPIPDGNIEPVNHACWRVDISPHWIQHQYFVAEVRAVTMAAK